VRSNSSPGSSGTGHGRGFPDEASFVFRSTACVRAHRRDTTVAGVTDRALQPWRRINEGTTARHAMSPMPTAQPKNHAIKGCRFWRRWRDLKRRDGVPATVPHTRPCCGQPDGGRSGGRTQRGV
jgi:hypothetical protein